MNNIHSDSNWTRTFSSNFVGVSFRKDKKTWRSRLCIKYKDIHLGDSRSEKQAALIYNTALEQLRGPLADFNQVF